MSYLSAEQVESLGALLKTFFSLPYSTDLDGKDAETPQVRHFQDVTL